MEKQLRRIYELVGESTTSWTQVEEFWYLIFTGLMPSTDRDVIDAIFGLFNISSRHRELIMAVAPHALKHDRKKIKSDSVERQKYRLGKRLGQLHARTNALAGSRNAAVHTAFEVADYMVPPRVVAVGSHKRSRMADEKDLIGALQRQAWKQELLLLDLIDLRDDLAELGQPGSSPDSLRQRIGLPILRDARKTARKRLLSLLDEE